LIAQAVNRCSEGRVPRRYTLGRRAEEQAATRARIVAAALVLYRERGSRAATTPVIARAADVSSGTVRNHFPERADLDRAVADAILTDIDLPGVGIFEGLDSVIERVVRLAHELADFSVRSEVWWQVREADPDLAVTWAGHERRYEEHLGMLVAAALGQFARDPARVAVVRTIIGSPMYYALRGSGLSSDEAVEVELAIVVPWLRALETGQTAESPARRGSSGAPQG
jgi:AcrR family transcriptional regulator